MKSKLFSLIVSVLAAMCLWVYVMTVVNPAPARGGRAAALSCADVR